MMNISLKKKGAEVIQASSTSNQILHPPSNILDENRQTIWCSGEGLPQYIIINLENVQIPYINIKTVGFLCLHDYDTNPKKIQIWASANDQEDEFIHWADCELKKRSGKQLFQIDAIPESYKLIKVVIRETFGEFQTYLNQIFLEAQLHERQISEEEYDEVHEWNPTDRLEEISGNSQSREQDSYQNNAAVLTISKNMIAMEDSIEMLARRMQVLEKRVSHTYESMQRNIMEKVEDIINKKLEKQLSERNLMPSTSQKHLRGNQMKKSTESNQEKKVMFLVKELEKKLKQRERKIKKLKLKQSRECRY